MFISIALLILLIIIQILAITANRTLDKWDLVLYPACFVLQLIQVIENRNVITLINTLLLITVFSTLIFNTYWRKK